MAFKNWEMQTTKLANFRMIVLQKKHPRLLETTTIKATPKEEEEEKRSPEGSRPGDRFKLLKEQEARRRQQREEEKRIGAEAVGNNIQITNGELKKEADLTDREDTELELRNTNDLSTTGNSSNSEDSVVNGSFSPTDSKEDQRSFLPEEGIATLGSGEETKVGTEVSDYQN